MSTISRARFEDAGDVRPFADGKGRMTVVALDGTAVGRGEFEAGWRWSEHVKPIAGTDSCQSRHAGYVLSGQMTIRMDDGTEETFGPGDVMVVDAGHDAWTVGTEPCVLLDWGGDPSYAKAAAG